MTTKLREFGAILGKIHGNLTKKSVSVTILTEIAQIQLTNERNYGIVSL